MLAVNNTRFSHIATSNCNSLPFFTDTFQNLAASLLRANSLPILRLFIESSAGVSSTVQHCKYLKILQLNIKLGPQDYKKLKRLPSQPCSRAWIEEMLYRALSELSQRHELAMSHNINILVHDIVAQLNLHDTTAHTYNVKMYLETNALSHFLQSNGIPACEFNLQMTVRHSLSIMNDLLCYYTRKGHQEFCALLTFYGAQYREHTNRSRFNSPSSDIVRKILAYRGVSYTHFENNVNTPEAVCEKRVFDAIARQRVKLSGEIEQINILLHMHHPWYYVFRKCMQIFYLCFKYPALAEADYSLQRLDLLYKKSMACGDCVKFFAEMEEILVNNTSLFLHYNKEFFADLRREKKSYKVRPHTEHMDAIKKEIHGCSMSIVSHSPTPEPLCGNIRTAIQLSSKRFSKFLFPNMKSAPYARGLLSRNIPQLLTINMLSRARNILTPILNNGKGQTRKRAIMHSTNIIPTPLNRRQKEVEDASTHEKNCRPCLPTCSNKTSHDHKSIMEAQITLPNEAHVTYVPKVHKSNSRCLSLESISGELQVGCLPRCINLPFRKKASSRHKTQYSEAKEEKTQTKHPLLKAFRKVRKACRRKSQHQTLP